MIYEISRNSSTKCRTYQTLIYMQNFHLSLACVWAVTQDSCDVREKLAVCGNDVENCQGKLDICFTLESTTAKTSSRAENVPLKIYLPPQRTYNHIHFNRIIFAWVIATGSVIWAKIGRKAETECPVAAHCNKIIQNLRTCISNKQTTSNNVCSVSRQPNKLTHVPTVYLVVLLAAGLLLLLATATRLPPHTVNGRTAESSHTPRPRRN